jgi:hypothetical protein
MCRVNANHINTRIFKGFNALQNIRSNANSRSYPQSSELVVTGIRFVFLFQDVLERNQSGKLAFYLRSAVFQFYSSGEGSQLS